MRTSGSSSDYSEAKFERHVAHDRHVTDMGHVLYAGPTGEKQSLAMGVLGTLDVNGDQIQGIEVMLGLSFQLNSAVEAIVRKCVDSVWFEDSAD